MGSPMAKRLVGAGFELKVFDVLDERTHPHRARSRKRPPS